MFILGCITSQASTATSLKICTSFLAPTHFFYWAQKVHDSVSCAPVCSKCLCCRSIGVKCSPETPADIPEEVQEQIEANSQAVIDKMARLFGGNNFEFGLDEDSVAYVDDLIDRNRRTWIREGSAERMMSMLGSYLGEAIINEYGGKWVQGYGVEIEEGFVAQPMVKVGKRIVNGIEEDSIAAFFNIVGTKLEQIRSDADE
eukprot:jgi/Bigna1/128910/aug1.7_g3618